MSILILADHDNGQLAGATLNTVTAASEIGGDIDLLVAGDASGDVAKAAAAISGVSRVLTADADMFAHGIAENIAPLVQSLASGYTHLMAPATTTGKNVMPRVAALLDVMQISDIIKVESDSRFQRPIYAGNAIATVTSDEAVKVITVRSTAFEAAGEGGNAAVDAGFVPNDYQVGQTGKVVAPDLYVAVGISGAIQHLAGMKDSKVIVAINKDEEAPIFQVADFGLVADLFDAVPELEAKLD